MRPEVSIVRMTRPTWLRRSSQDDEDDDDDNDDVFNQQESVKEDKPLCASSSMGCSAYVALSIYSNEL